MKLAETETAHVTWSWKSVDKDHPIWGILKIVLCGMVLIGSTYVNAQHVDSGEWKTILSTLSAILLAEGVNVRKKLGW